MSTGPWTVRLSEAAEEDIRSILRWSQDQFGPRQAGVYEATLTLAIETLSKGPSQPGVRSRSDIARGCMSLHIARRGRRGRHFLVFRVSADRERSIDVFRVLHDAMDLQLNLNTGP